MSTTAAGSTLSLEIAAASDPAMVTCSGRLVLGACGRLHSAVSPLFRTRKRVILDLTNLTHMDSMGLGTIVRLYVSAKSAGSCLELINLSPRIRQLLGITNLLSVLTNVCEQGVSLRF